MSDDSEEGLIGFIFKGICSFFQNIIEQVISYLVAKWGIWNNLSPWYRGWIISFFISVIILPILCYFYSSNNDIDSPIMSLEYLPGTYHVSILYDGIEQDTKTAKIQYHKENEYRSIMVSEYSPEYITIYTDKDGNLSSQVLGKGKLEYNRKLDKVTLIFVKEHFVWKMTR